MNTVRPVFEAAAEDSSASVERHVRNEISTLFDAVAIEGTKGGPRTDEAKLALSTKILAIFESELKNAIHWDGSGRGLEDIVRWFRRDGATVTFERSREVLVRGRPTDGAVEIAARVRTIAGNAISELERRGAGAAVWYAQRMREEFEGAKRDSDRKAGELEGRLASLNRHLRDSVAKFLADRRHMEAENRALSEAVESARSENSTFRNENVRLEEAVSLSGKETVMWRKAAVDERLRAEKAEKEVRAEKFRADAAAEEVGGLKSRAERAERKIERIRTSVSKLGGKTAATASIEQAVADTVESLMRMRSDWVGTQRKISEFDAERRRWGDERAGLERALTDERETYAELLRLVPERTRESMDAEYHESFADFFYAILRNIGNDTENYSEIRKRGDRFRKAYFTLRWHWIDTHAMGEEFLNELVGMWKTRRDLRACMKEWGVSVVQLEAVKERCENTLRSFLSTPSADRAVRAYRQMSESATA